MLIHGSNALLVHREQLVESMDTIKRLKETLQQTDEDQIESRRHKPYDEVGEDKQDNGEAANQQETQGTTK